MIHRAVNIYKFTCSVRFVNFEYGYFLKIKTSYVQKES